MSFEFNVDELSQKSLAEILGYQTKGYNSVKLFNSASSGRFSQYIDSKDSVPVKQMNANSTLFTLAVLKASSDLGEEQKNIIHTVLIHRLNECFDEAIEEKKISTIDPQDMANTLETMANFYKTQKTFLE